MKTLFIVLMMAASPLFAQTQPAVQQSLIYPQLDLAYLHVRKAILSEDADAQWMAYEQLNETWVLVSADILRYNIPHFNLAELVDVQDLTLGALETSLGGHDYEGALRELRYFRWNMMDVRACLTSKYPLDQLYRALDQYHRLAGIVHDPMMELTQWFEFEDVIDDMFASWDKYIAHVSDVPQYFSGFDLSAQFRLHERMQDCKAAFVDALEDGYRPDFELPCDRIGETLEESLNLYLQHLRVNSAWSFPESMLN